MSLNPVDTTNLTPPRYVLRDTHEVQITPCTSVVVSGVSRRRVGQRYANFRIALKYELIIKVPDGNNVKLDATPVEAWEEGNLFLELAQSKGFDWVRDAFLQPARPSQSAKAAREPYAWQFFKTLERVVSGDISTAKRYQDVTGADQFEPLELDTALEDVDANEDTCPDDEDRRLSSLTIREFKAAMSSTPALQASPDYANIGSRPALPALGLPPFGPAARDIKSRKKNKKKPGRKH